MAYSEILLKSPGGKSVRFNGILYKAPCSIPVFSEQDLKSLTLFLDASNFEFEVKGSLQVTNQVKKVMKRGRIPNKDKSKETVTPIERKKEEFKEEDHYKKRKKEEIEKTLESENNIE